MTSGATVGAVLLQGGILGSLYVGLRRDNLAAAINATVAFLVGLSPAVLELVARGAFDASLGLGPELALWLALAGFLHAIGMLGLYESTGWWDHLTHVVSAAFVAALVYGALVGLQGRAVGFDPTTAAIVTGTVGLTFLAGVFWELLELVAREVGERYGIDPVLVVYGRRDTVLDLVFDVVGAVLVVALDVRLFAPLAGRAPGVTRWLVLGSGAVLVLGSLLLGVGLAVFGRVHPWADR